MPTYPTYLRLELPDEGDGPHYLELRPTPDGVELEASRGTDYGRPFYIIREGDANRIVWLLVNAFPELLEGHALRPPRGLEDVFDDELEGDPSNGGPR